MNTIWPMILAVMTANLLTVCFLYGLSKALKIHDDRDATAGIILCMLAPLAVLAAGFFIYG
jgi:hypothetical protein